MGSIGGALAIAAFVGGLFCRRLGAAILVSAAIAVLYAALVVIGLWHVLPGANLVYLGGALGMASLAIGAPALLAFYLKRGVARFLGGSGAKTA